jgi:hypothetical protein
MFFAKSFCRLLLAAQVRASFFTNNQSGYSMQLSFRHVAPHIGLKNIYLKPG